MSFLTTHALTAYGFISVALMLVFYALENRSHWFVLLFAAACLMSSIYGFLQGLRPLEPSKGSGRSSRYVDG